MLNWMRIFVFYLFFQGVIFLRASFVAKFVRAVGHSCLTILSMFDERFLNSPVLYTGTVARLFAHSTFSLIILMGRTQSPSNRSIVPEAPYFWKEHFVTWNKG